MTARWIALLFLSGSWLFGLSYYHQSNLWLWAGLVVPGLLLILLPVGGATDASPRERVGRSALLFIYILCAQRLALALYESATAFSHQLPAPLARLLAGIARLTGMEAAFNGSEIALYTMRRVHRLAATWELLLDPVSLTLLIGGIVLLFCRHRRPWKATAKLALLVAAWLPLRAVLLMAILLHRTWLTDYDAKLQVMELFWNPWVLIALAGIPALVAAALIKPPAPPEQDEVAPPKRNPRTAVAGTTLLLLAAAITAVALHWDPIGKRKPGRVLVDEYHSTWEPTQRPFDTEWYGHDAGYNYACIYDYASRYYEMGRLTNAITTRALQDCDVLMLKVPTSAYTADEVYAITHFVEQGGGVMLVGEHTDVYLTSTHLNQVARMFGFEFRNDCLFGIDTTFEQHYRPPRVPHPILQHMPPIDFAVSCSIKPLTRAGRAVVRSTGLWNLPADYHASNYYPQIEDRADARYGAFVQLWSMRHGKGRVVGFTDSTIFSNFSAFEPGKAELMLGMLEWLNHRNTGGDPRNKLLALALLLGVPALILLRHRPAWLLIVVTAVGWSVAAQGIRMHHARRMPPPTPLRDCTRFTIDRTLCSAPLSKSGFIKASPRGFGICEQWILKLGFFLSRHEGADLFEGDVATFFHPDVDPTPAFARQLTEYVAQGGTLLLFDSAVNSNSTANTILLPFGLTVDHTQEAAGILQTPAGWPEAIETTASRFVNGGTPFIVIDGKPVAAYAKHGEGCVTVIGCGDRFNDDNMGITTDVEPTPELRNVFELEFKILRAVVNHTQPAL